MYQLIALDLDGTLTNDAKEVTPHTKKVLREAAQKGAAIALVSGRPTIGILRLARELELDKIGGFILAYNGGQIIDCKTGEDIFRAQFPRDCIEEAIGFSRQAHIAMVAYDADGIVTEGPVDQYVLHESRNNDIPVKQVEDLAAYLHDPFVKLLLCGAPERIAGLEPVMAAHFRGRLDIYQAESVFLEVMPLGINKAAGLEKLMRKLGVDRKAMMACGDANNDLPMMRLAGLSVAMGNAYENVKQAADFITKSNNDDGVAYAIERFVLDSSDGI